MFKRLSLSFIIVSLLSINTVNANDEVDPLANFSITPGEIQKSLENLKKNGQISQEDYDKATKQLAGMSANEITALKETAIGMVRNDPDKAVELTKGKINTAEIEKQINDLSKPNP